MVFIMINIYIYIWCHILPQKIDLWYHICPPEKRVWVTQFARRLFIFRCCKFQRRQGYSPRFVTIWRREDLYLVSVLLGEGGFADLFPTLNWVHPWKISGWKIWHFLPTWSLFFGTCSFSAGTTKLNGNNKQFEDGNGSRDLSRRFGMRIDFDVFFGSGGRSLRIFYPRFRGFWMLVKYSIDSRIHEMHDL